MIKEVDEAGDEIRLVITSEIADVLRVPKERIRQWYRRRKGNGFPEAVGTRYIPVNGMYARHWDLDEVRAWAINRASNS